MIVSTSQKTKIRELLAPLIISQSGTTPAPSAVTVSGPQLAYILQILLKAKPRKKRKPRDVLKLLRILKALKALGVYTRINWPMEIDLGS